MPGTIVWSGRLPSEHQLRATSLTGKPSGTQIRADVAGTQRADRMRMGAEPASLMILSGICVPLLALTVTQEFRQARSEDG